MKKYLQIVFFIGVGITIGLFFYFNLHTWLQVENIELVKTYFLNLGMAAPFYMILLYIIFNMAAIPRVFFTIFFGYVFGLLYGFLFAWLATLAGLVVTFISIRYLFQEKFEKRFGKRELVERLNKQIEKRGILIVIFLRAIYIFPSSILNYSFGFTKIKTITYLLGSAIGFIPVVFINVYAGHAISKSIITKTFDYVQVIVFLGVITIAVLILKYIGKKNRFFSKLTNF